MGPFIFLFGARKRVAHVRAFLNCRWRRAREKPGKRSQRRSTFVLEMREWTGDVSRVSDLFFSALVRHSHSRKRVVVRVVTRGSRICFPRTWLGPVKNTSLFVHCTANCRSTFNEHESFLYKKIISFEDKIMIFFVLIN